MPTLKVGVGQEYSSVEAAVAASQSGDTIDVQAGTYTNDFTTIGHDLTLQAVGGIVTMVATTSPPDGKAILDEGGVGVKVTIDGFAFTGAAVNDGNGAGIRYEGGTLDISNSDFYGNQDGILGAADPNGIISITSSEFYDSGTGDGKTHNIYIGNIQSFSLTDSFVHDENVGNEVKSRAASNTITNNRIFDNTSSASYEIDLPNGGNATIAGNVIEQGPNSQNYNIIAYGEEGDLLPGTTLSITGNTILNDLGRGPALWNASSATVATFTDNLVYGFGNSALVTGAAVQSGTVVLATEPALDQSAPYSVPAAVACFCHGTLILTHRGEVAVEDLQIGDLAVTLSDKLRPIRWIGRRSYDGRFIAANHLMLPICIKAGALAKGAPSRDLHVSPGHAMFVDGQLVPAWRLLNGVSVVQAEAVESVTYYHVEVDCHAIILAEGALAESFLDDKCRGQFQNADEYHRLYPDAAAMIPLQSRLEDGFGLQALQERVAARAGISMTVEPLGPLRGFVDMAAYGSVRGWAQDVESPEEPVALEILIGGSPVVCLLANAYRADLRYAGLGSGCHAFEMELPPEFPGHVEVRRIADALMLQHTAAAVRLGNRRAA